MLVNFITALFSREKGLILIPWLVFYVSLHLLAVFLNTEFMRGKAMEIASHVHHNWLSYVIVMMAAAVLAGFYWKGINVTVDTLAAATQDKPTDKKDDEKKKDNTSTNARKKNGKGKASQEQHNSGGTNNQQQQNNSGGINIQQQSSAPNSPNSVQIGTDRTIDPQIVTDKLKGYPGTRVSFIPNPGDGEEYNLIKSLEKGMQKAGWNSYWYTEHYAGGRDDSGIIITKRGANDKAAEALYELLDHANLHPSYEPNRETYAPVEQMPADIIIVTVAKKP